MSALRTHLVPARHPSGHTLVVLHGRGDHAGGWRFLPDALGLDGLDHLLVDAPDPWGPGLSWYDLPPHQAPGVARSRALLDELFDRLEAAGRPPERTALLGFSQGCLMALEWGARTARPLAAYVGLSGYVLDPEALLAEAHPQARRDVWLVTHGLHDDVLPFEVTAAQVARLQEGGLPLQFEAYAKDHTVDLGDELDRVREHLASRLGLAK